jgi:hypothetical protein
MGKATTFRPGDKVWTWDGRFLYERVIESEIRGGFSPAYRMVKTTAYSEDIYTEAHIYAYPDDAEALMNEMSDDISSIEYKRKEVEAVAFEAQV